MNVHCGSKFSALMNGGSSASGIFQLAPAQVAVRVVLGALISWLGLGALGVEAAPSGRNSARLNPGDIVFTDSEAAVMRLDPVTMQPSVLAVGGPLVRPCGIAVSPEKTIYVTDTGSLSVIAITRRQGIRQYCRRAATSAFQLELRLTPTGRSWWPTAKRC